MPDRICTKCGATWQITHETAQAARLMWYWCEPCVREWHARVAAQIVLDAFSAPPSVERSEMPPKSDAGETPDERAQAEWDESVRRGRELGARCVCAKNPQTGRCDVHESDPNAHGWSEVSAEVRRRIWGEMPQKTEEKP